MKKDCVFCDRTKIEERIIYENRNFYVIATLGQITDGGYTLLIPKEHISCTAALTKSRTTEMLDLCFEIDRALSLEYCNGPSSGRFPITIFEHGIVGQTIEHAHLHFLPVVIDLTPRIKKDFPTAEFEELYYAAHIQDIYRQKPRPYLFWTKPKDISMVCWNPPAPREYLRIIFGEILGRPERSHWRKMDPNLDKKLWSETVYRLKSYFV